MIRKFKNKLKNYLNSRHRQYLIFGAVLLLIVAFSLGLTAGYFCSQKLKQKTVGPGEKNVYSEFLIEIYDKIKENYWDKISDEQLSNFFKLGAEKITNKPQGIESKDKDGIKKMVAKITEEMDPQKKKEFVTALGDIVLANLNPFGRSRLYTSKKETELKNVVQNIDQSTNLYETLGLGKNASQAEIEKTYQEKSTELNEIKDQSPEAKKKFEELERAYAALSKPENREVYNKTGAEPTVVANSIRPNIVYLQIKRFSPSTFDELQKETEIIDKKAGQKPEPNALIIDLRANIGGSIDLLPYFLGSFIGQNQYAYEFFHQGNYTPFKTLTGWLPSLIRYKKVVVLIDGETQSSAEVMASVLKKYNVGILVGTKTKGWGTIEKIFPINQQVDPNETYSMFLVHSITVREDGQPIEGKSVEPVINIYDLDWDKQLFTYFNYQELIDTVKEILKQ